MRENLGGEQLNFGNLAAKTKSQKLQLDDEIIVKKEKYVHNRLAMK
jgi:hypothetical protein